MNKIPPEGLLHHFQDLPDPRKARGIRHQLRDIVCISILAVICNADTFPEIHAFATLKQVWLKTFLELPHGIPSQDTFERVFSLLKPGAWQSCFLAWTQSLCLPELPEGEQEVLAIDGKTSRRSHNHGMGALHTVSVWSSQFEVSLGQLDVPEKTNEITVIPELLEVIQPAGAVVTIDAMGTQKNIAWTIREHHADYVLALKDNHTKLFEDTQWLFSHADGLGWQDLESSYAKTETRDHGRIETRECWVLTNLEILDDLKAWRDLNAVVRVRGTREVKGKVSVEDRFFITSLPADAQRIMRAVRLHWGIENGLHWVLDVAFDEDHSRARLGFSQANWVAIRHLAISVLKRDKSVKAGVATKRFRAGLDQNYLLKLLKS
jgi:predicted transposase YbfD/YdcC